MTKRHKSHFLYFLLFTGISIFLFSPWEYKLIGPKFGLIADSSLLLFLFDYWHGLLFAGIALFFLLKFLLGVKEGFSTGSRTEYGKASAPAVRRAKVRSPKNPRDRIRERKKREKRARLQARRLDRARSRR